MLRSPRGISSSATAGFKLAGGNLAISDAVACTDVGPLTVAAAGTLKAPAEGLRALWYVEAGSSRGANQTYYGYGWPGQPVIARWSKQVRQSSNLYESKQSKEKLKDRDFLARTLDVCLDITCRSLADIGDLSDNSTVSEMYPVKVAQCNRCRFFRIFKFFYYPQCYISLRIKISFQI